MSNKNRFRQMVFLTTDNIETIGVYVIKGRVNAQWSGLYGRAAKNTSRRDFQLKFLRHLRRKILFVPKLGVVTSFYAPYKAKTT